MIVHKLFIFRTVQWSNLSLSALPGLPVHCILRLSLLHNILLSGNAPTTLSPYFAGGNLTSLDLLKPKGSGWVVRQIAVGETLRRLVGKCVCVLTKEKATQFFNPFQYGVACSAGTEKVVHKLRQAIEDNWNNGDFAIKELTRVVKSLKNETRV